MKSTVLLHQAGSTELFGGWFLSDGSLTTSAMIAPSSKKSMKAFDQAAGLWVRFHLNTPAALLQSAVIDIWRKVFGSRIRAWADVESDPYVRVGFWLFLYSYLSAAHITHNNFNQRSPTVFVVLVVNAFNYPWLICSMAERRAIPYWWMAFSSQSSSAPQLKSVRYWSRLFDNMVFRKLNKVDLAAVIVMNVSQRFWDRNCWMICRSRY